jgi:hypothetical protein
MLRAALLGALLLASCSSTPEPPSPAEPPPSPPELLAPFAKLVDGAWTAAFNAEIYDEQSFSWVFGGRFLRNRHQVRTTKDGQVVYEGETIYAIDPTTSQIVWWYWNATGGHIVGTARWEDGVCIFEGENHGAPGQTQRVRSTVEIGDDGWTARIWYLATDGSWALQNTRAYRRAR